MRGVQPARRREVARGFEHDPALAGRPRVIQHPAHQALPDAEPARVRFDEQEPELRRGLGQPLDRDRTGELERASPSDSPDSR